MSLKLTENGKRVLPFEFTVLVDLHITTKLKFAYAWSVEHHLKVAIKFEPQIGDGDGGDLGR